MTEFLLCGELSLNTDLRTAASGLMELVTRDTEQKNCSELKTKLDGDQGLVWNTIIGNDDVWMINRSD